MISNDTTLGTGETPLLACVGFGEPEVEISWSFNGAPVVNTSLITITEEDVVQGQRIFKLSFLQICSLSTPNVGGYTCLINNGQRTVSSTVNVLVVEESKKHLLQ